MIDMYARTNVNSSQGRLNLKLTSSESYCDYNYQFISKQTYLIDDISNKEVL